MFDYRITFGLNERQQRDVPSSQMFPLVGKTSSAAGLGTSDPYLLVAALVFGS
jgi:hypothetical protein